MSIRTSGLQLLAEETQALLTRLERVKPLPLHETMLPAAAPSPVIVSAVEEYLAQGRAALRQAVLGYQRWLRGPEAAQASLAEAQRRLTFLRLRFHAVLTQFDIFSNVMTQRSEFETGVWMAGLDIAAADLLELTGSYYQPPPVVCYLSRGHGAAIRRARTRLPGGGSNPVAIIQVPRERMIGASGIASSLAHEVGHQGAALLDLIASLRPSLQRMQGAERSSWSSWGLFERWISEILADLWSVARVGVASTQGLISVVSLPRAFVFRVALDDPHPIPWIRVKLSCAMGAALYPDPQWARLAAIWEAFYPLAGLDVPRRDLLTRLEGDSASFVDLLVNHRPAALRGQSLREALAEPERQPSQLRAQHEAWRAAPRDLWEAHPSMAFAVIGQARADDRLSPAAEGRIVSELLNSWALRSTLDTSAMLADLAKLGPRGTPILEPTTPSGNGHLANSMVAV